jgi:hypothetical protein
LEDEIKDKHLQAINVRMYTAFNWNRTGYVAVSSDRLKENPGLIKRREFFDHLNYYQVLKRDYVPRIQSAINNNIHHSIRLSLADSEYQLMKARLCCFIVNPLQLLCSERYVTNLTFFFLRNCVL